MQPIVYGAALRLNPLVVFSVTIAAGTLFGVAGMVLAAPLISAAVRIHQDLRQEMPTAENGTDTRAPPTAVGGIDSA